MDAASPPQRARQEKRLTQSPSAAHAAMSSQHAALRQSKQASGGASKESQSSAEAGYRSSSMPRICRQLAATTTTASPIQAQAAARIRRRPIVAQGARS